MIRKRKIKVSSERNLLIGLAISTPFLKSIYPELNLDLFQADVSKLLCNWILEYHEEFGKAPGKLLQEIYDQKVRKDDIDEDLADDMADLMDSLSNQYEKEKEYDFEYYLKQSRAYLDERRIKITIREASQALHDDEPLHAQEVLENYRSIELHEDLGFNPFTNADKIRTAFETFQDPLFTYPGALDVLFNNQFSEGTFISFLAPAKRGKTWWLDELAFRAHRFRNRVALFQIGDLSEEQQVRRLHVRLCQKSYDQRYCGEIKIPIIDCLHNQTDSCSIKKRTCDFGLYEEPEKEDEPPAKISFEDATELGYVPCTYCLKRNPQKFKGAVWYKIREKVEPLTWREGYRAGLKWMSKFSGSNDFRVVARPSLRINELISILEIWANRGWIPKVLVLDYIDLLEWSDNRIDMRHKINEVWKAVRQISLKYNLCFITATQADSDGLETRKLRTKNFSESGRKWDHVTAAYALNQTAKEKKDKIMRMSPLLGREGEFDQSLEIKVLQSLETGRPYLGSYF